MMKRQTALNHMFMHGQTILYGGRGLSPMDKPLRVMFTRRANRWIILRSPSGHADISFMASDPFWAAPAMPDAESLLRELTVEYVSRSRRDGVTTIERAAMADMVIFAAMVTYGLDMEAATEHIGDMINDIETGRN